MKKLIITLFAAVSCLAIANAQSLFNNHLYTNNLYSLNPSYAGLKEDLSFSFQSTLYPGAQQEAPEFISVFMEAAFFENLAAGGSFYKEVFGGQERTIGQASLAYRVGFTNSSRLSFGLALGFSNVRIQTERLNLTPYVDRTDPVLALDDVSQNDLTLGYGMNYSIAGFDIGVSLPNMLTGQQLTWKEANFNAGYNYHLKGAPILIRPNVAYFTRTEQDNVVDGSLQVEWNQKLWAQGGMRSNGFNHAAIGLNLPNIKVGYAFGWAGGDVSQLLSSKHELMITFALSRDHNVKLGSNRLALENNEEQNYRSMMQKFDRLIMQYEEMSANTETKSKADADQQEKLDKLNEEISVLKSQLEDQDHTVVINDELLSDKITIKKGHYVIVATCRRLICAEDLTREFEEKGLDTEVVLNRNKGLYYITSGFYEGYQEALDAMMKKREDGVADAWVLVNDFEKDK